MKIVQEREDAKKKKLYNYEKEKKRNEKRESKKYPSKKY